RCSSRIAVQYSRLLCCSIVPPMKKLLWQMTSLFSMCGSLTAYLSRLKAPSNTRFRIFNAGLPSKYTSLYFSDIFALNCCFFVNFGELINKKM
ncbi:hypothetical protein, partial [Providencia sp. Me31A]|uniref:hypothetical protein n=1 Tax=Providencia sp. Me31A TaxID=3392637 RepID=UPI003D2C5A9F